MRRLILAAAVAALTVGCGGTTDSDTNQQTNNGGVNNGANNGGANNGSVEARTIQGRLTSEASGEAGAESKTVTASGVDSEGNVEEFDGAETETDADGKYVISLEESLDADTTILVRAWDGDEALGSVSFGAGSTAQGDADGELMAPPITVESTTEANVMIAAHVSGDWCTSCTVAELESRIDSETAAAVEATAETDGEVYTRLSSSIIAGMQAHDEMLLEESMGVTESDLEAAQNATLEAHSKLQSSLAVASSDDEIDAARDAYAEAYMQASLDSGITVEDLATASHAEAAARTTSSVTTDTDLQARLLSNVEHQRATLVTAAIEASFEAQGEANSTVDSAGDTLLAELEAAADAGAEAESDIESAWSDYHATVKAEITAQLDATQETAVSGLESTLASAADVYAQAVATLDSTVSATTTATNSVKAVSELHASIVTNANVEALTSAGLEEETARAYLEIMFHLRASTALSASS